MNISIIIVNYNVQYFIEQCLDSIFKVSDYKGVIEVIVVDNDSSDGSRKLIRDHYPEVLLIENENNVGFSIANNQGIKLAKGKYILLLNPDTLLSENTLTACFAQMESSPKIGALGVRMVDGAGQFLPESKRGFPSPSASFYRFSGLYKLFPQSPVINSYYQGHIGEMQTAETEILCGAFMFIRTKVLDEIGLLDEAFFMYGEDIDLSYRIRNAGYSVLYFPETSIVHFKGESTRKDSIAYTQRFYDAMDIFANKHFKNRRASSFLKSLSFIIWLKAFLFYLKGIFSKLFLPFIDVVCIFGGLYIISSIWARFYFGDADYYSNAPLTLNFTLYTLIWVLFVFFGGGYDKQIKLMKVMRNLLIGTFAILAIYGLLEESYRSSRAVILISAFFAIIVLPLLRVFLGQFGMVEVDNLGKRKKVLVLSNDEEFRKIKRMLNAANTKIQIIEQIPVDVSTYELSELIKVRGFNEVICNVRQVGMQRVIELMSAIGSEVSIKITGEDSLGIIGSQSKNTSGEIYTMEVNYNIQSQSSKRNKKIFDFIIWLILTILIPLTIFFSSTRKIIFRGRKLLVGQQTIIGYHPTDQLPRIAEPVFQISDTEARDYAKNYTVWKDFRYLWNYL
ncbi:glycosyltransferase family 2 protein [Portibacter marinus]|uniref:glycosyltransferase family 2 protein n=1 Tax=Portibacter marinus TaxID=2898660 RepID=UPI001F40C089|nr:glycosyltransferase [Portibacter marinus]